MLNFQDLMTGVLLSVCVHMTGCGPQALEYETTEVEGAITVNGESLKDGMIRFIPDGEVIGGQVAGKPIFAKIQDGKYIIDPDKGATVGKNRVEITSYRGTGKMELTSAGIQEEITEQFIPKQYNSASELSIEIEPGPNLKDFDLTVSGYKSASPDTPKETDTSLDP